MEQNSLPEVDYGAELLPRGVVEAAQLADLPRLHHRLKLHSAARKEGREREGGRQEGEKGGE